MERRIKNLIKVKKIYETLQTWEEVYFELVRGGHLNVHRKLLFTKANELIGESKSFLSLIRLNENEENHFFLNIKFVDLFIINLLDSYIDDSPNPLEVSSLNEEAKKWRYLDPNAVIIMTSSLNPLRNYKLLSKDFGPLIKLGELLVRSLEEDWYGGHDNYIEFVEKVIPGGVPYDEELDLEEIEKLMTDLKKKIPLSPKLVDSSQLII